MGKVIAADRLVVVHQRLHRDGAPGAVLARRQVENEHVAVQLRIELAAGVMIETHHHEAGTPLADGAGLAAAGAGRRALKMGAVATASRCIRSMPVRSLGSDSAHSTDSDLGALNVMSQPAVWFCSFPPNAARRAPVRESIP